MLDSKSLQQDIENLRSYLHKLINDENRSLNDHEILVVSQVLNSAISRYHKISKDTK